MKRNLIICILVIIFSLSFAVQAENETMLEETWDKLLPTTDLGYSAEEGKINLRFRGTDDQRSYYTLQGYYGFRDYIRFNGHVSGSGESDLQFAAGVKAKVFEQDSFVVATNVSATYYENYDMNYNLAVFTDKTFGNDLTLHNCLSFSIDDTNIFKSLITGLDYRFNQQHALKAKLYTNFTDFDSLNNTIDLMYKNDFDDQISFLSSIRKTLSVDNMLFSNLVEVEPISDLFITGYYHYNTKYNDILGIKVQKDFTNFTLTSGYEYNTASTNTIFGKLNYDFRDDLEMDLKITRGTWNSGDTTELRTGVSYLL